MHCKAYISVLLHGEPRLHAIVCLGMYGIRERFIRKYQVNIFHMKRNALIEIIFVLAFLGLIIPRKEKFTMKNIF